MRTKEIKCPSGLVVVTREFLVKDEDLLADAKALRQGRSGINILNAITTQILDFGPYAESGGGKLNWSQVLQGDSMVILLKSRIETWGPEYLVRVPCDNCRQPVAHEIDLNDLPIKDLPESSLAHVTDPQNNPLGCKLPSCGKRVEFKLLRCKDEKNLGKIQRQNKQALSSSLTRYRVTKIEGVKPPDIANFLRNMSGRDLVFLRSAFDDADGGVEQEIELECDSCGHVWPKDIQLSTDFLFPKQRTKKATR